MEKPNLSLVQIAQSLPAQPLSEKQRIILSLTEMAVLRGAEVTENQMLLYSTQLSQYPLEPVLRVLKTLGETEREEGKPAFPEFGLIQRLLLEEVHPLRVLRRAVRIMAGNFGLTVTNEMIERFEKYCGHRIDEDIEIGLTSVMKDRYLKKMPTTGEFLEFCGEMRKRRQA